MLPDGGSTPPFSTNTEGSSGSRLAALFAFSDPQSAMTPSPFARRPTWTLVKVSVRLALILMTLSLALCREVRTPEALESVALGLPVPFVTLDARRLGAEGLPRCVRFGRPRVDPMRLRPRGALASLVSLTLALVVAARALGLGWRPRGGAGAGR